MIALSPLPTVFIGSIKIQSQKNLQVYYERMVDLSQNVPFVLHVLHLLQSYHIGQSQDFHCAVYVCVLVSAEHDSPERSGT